MDHYITPDNKLFGFEDHQTHLIPANAVLIPASYTMDQIPHITLVDGAVHYDQTKHDADKAAAQAVKDAKVSALSKLSALGFTQEEIAALTN